MGGLNALRLVESQKSLQLAGLILVAPALGLHTKPSSMEMALGSFVANFCPQYTVDNRLNFNHLSRDPEQVDKYKNDRLVHKLISLQTAKTMLDYQDHLLKATKDAIQINCPLLLSHGSADKVTSFSISKDTFDKIDCPDKTFKAYEEAYHSCI